MEFVLKGKINYSVTDGIAILEVDNPPVNPLSDGVRHGLIESMEKAESDDSVVGIVLTGKGRSFIAGADISEFGQQIEGPSIHDAFEKIEKSTKPVIAAINGSALGGGLETALCCHYRVSSKQGFIGLPEVNLGLLPGAGGTQRLPRLVGPAEALKIMLSGRHIPAVKAVDMGVIDSLSEGDIVEDAIAFAKCLELSKINNNNNNLDPKEEDRLLQLALEMSMNGMENERGNRHEEEEEPIYEGVVESKS